VKHTRIKREPDRLVVSNVHHAGGTTIYITAADDDFPMPVGWVVDVDSKGRLSMTFRNEGDVPMSAVFGVDGEGVKVFESEDVFPIEGDYATLIFDSEEVK
jgi:hypothetical protein